MFEAGTGHHGEPVAQAQQQLGEQRAVARGHVKFPCVVAEGRQVRPGTGGGAHRAPPNWAEADPGLLRVSDLAERLGVSERTLQRLAARYVGLGPAALIRRRRLQEAAERIRTDPDADLASLAAELGYTDQAHLTNEFTRVLGLSPAGYRRDAAG